MSGTVSVAGSGTVAGSVSVSGSVAVTASVTASSPPCHPERSGRRPRNRGISPANPRPSGPAPSTGVGDPSARSLRSLGRDDRGKTVTVSGAPPPQPVPGTEFVLVSASVAVSVTGAGSVSRSVPETRRHPWREGAMSFRPPVRPKRPRCRPSSRNRSRTWNRTRTRTRARARARTPTQARTPDTASATGTVHLTAGGRVRRRARVGLGVEILVREQCTPRSPPPGGWAGWCTGGRAGGAPRPPETMEHAPSRDSPVLTLPRRVWPSPPGGDRGRGRPACPGGA